MNLHTLTTTPGSRRRSKRVGRGESSGLGKTSGRGNKGQYSRAGAKHRPMFEGGQMPLMRRLPKRGFTPPTRTAYRPVNVGELAVFKAGATVDPVALRAIGLVRGSPMPVKLLGHGEIDRALTVRAQGFSAAARKKIEAAGGACETIR